MGRHGQSDSSSGYGGCSSFRLSREKMKSAPKETNRPVTSQAKLFPAHPLNMKNIERQLANTAIPRTKCWERDMRKAAFRRSAVRFQFLPVARCVCTGYPNSGQYEAHPEFPRPPQLPCIASGLHSGNRDIHDVAIQCGHGGDTCEKMNN